MLAIGETLPELRFLDADEREIEVAHFWRQRPTIVVFLRHFG